MINAAKNFYNTYKSTELPVSTGAVMYFAPSHKTIERYNGDMTKAWAEYAIHAVTNNQTDKDSKHFRSYGKEKVEVVMPLIPQIVAADQTSISRGSAIYYFKIDEKHLARLVAQPENGNLRLDNLVEITATYARGKVPDATMPLVRAVEEWTSRGDTPDSTTDVTTIAHPGENVNGENPRLSVTFSPEARAQAQLVRDAKTAVDEVEAAKEEVGARYSVFSHEEYASIGDAFAEDTKKPLHDADSLTTQLQIEDASPVVTAQNQQSETRLPGTIPATSRNGDKSVSLLNKNLQAKINKLKGGLSKKVLLVEGLTKKKIRVTPDNFVSAIASTLGLTKRSHSSWYLKFNSGTSDGSAVSQLRLSDHPANVNNIVMGENEQFVSVVVHPHYIKRKPLGNRNGRIEEYRYSKASMTNEDVVKLASDIVEYLETGNFSNTSGGKKFHPGVNAIDDVNHRDLYERYKAGDETALEEARQMVREAAAKAMPNTKVVDENGEPLVVYHGTKSGGFWVFDESYNKSGEGDDQLIGCRVD